MSPLPDEIHSEQRQWTVGFTWGFTAKSTSDDNLSRLKLEFECSNCCYCCWCSCFVLKWTIVWRRTLLRWQNRVRWSSLPQVHRFSAPITNPTLLPIQNAHTHVHTDECSCLLFLSLSCVTILDWTWVRPFLKLRLSDTDLFWQRAHWGESYWTQSCDAIAEQWITQACSSVKTWCDAIATRKWKWNRKYRPLLIFEGTIETQSAQTKFAAVVRFLSLVASAKPAVRWVVFETVVSTHLCASGSDQTNDGEVSVVRYVRTYVVCEQEQRSTKRCLFGNTRVNSLLPFAKWACWRVDRDSVTECHSET